MIQFDPGLRTYREGESIVISCSHCGHVWRALQFTRADAYAAGERHQTITHGVAPEVAATARRLWERRERLAKRIR